MSDNTHMEIVTDDTLVAILQELERAEVISMDSETNKTDKEHERYCMGFSIYEPVSDKGYYFPLRHSNLAMGSNLTIELPTFTPRKILWHNGKFDRKVFKKIGWNLDSIPFEDTILMSYVLQMDPPHDLKGLSDIHIGAGSSDDQIIIKAMEKIFGSWEKIPVGPMAKYAIRDTILTHDLYMVLAGKLGALPEVLTQVYMDDLETSEIFQEIEELGLKIDPVESRLKSAQCTQLMNEMQAQFGYDLGKDSQVADRLFTMPPQGLGLKPLEVGAPSKSYPSGRPKMGKEILEQYHHPEVSRILEYRRIKKAKTSYYDSYLDLIDDDNRLHPTFNLFATVTGRLSCSNPNLQQIPRDTEENATKAMFPIKKLIREDEGWEVWEADFSHQELRLASVYAEAEAMLKAFQDGLDPHQILADQLGVTRFIAKQCNFLLPYGGSANKLYMTIRALAPGLNFTIQNARDVYGIYHTANPEFKRVAEHCMMVAMENGFIKLWSGRRKHFSDDHYKAFNGLIQGGAGDLTKEAMRRIHRLKLKNTQMISQVHDSIIFRTRDSKEIDLCVEQMMWPSEFFSIPFLVDAKRLW